MSAYTTRVLTSPAQISQSADRWDDLWHRSAACTPTLRAQLIARHIERFTPRSRIWCPVIENENGIPVAALPLFESRRALVSCGTLPNNEWSGCGDLLLDESADAAAICDCLAAALRHAPWPMLWLDWIPYCLPRWQTFFAALERQGASCETKHAFDVGIVPTTGSWEDYQASWSKNQRRNIRRYEKQLGKSGAVTCEIKDRFSADEVETWLKTAFEVEDRNWKGAQGSSILRTPGMWEFYLDQARQLATWDQLCITLIRVGEKPIASEFGYFAKGVHFAMKIGYDSEFQKQGPGNILQSHSLERAFRSEEINAIDFLGPISRSCESWRPNRYAVGKAIIAPGSLVGRAMLGAYRHVWPAFKRLKGEPTEASA